MPDWIKNWIIKTVVQDFAIDWIEDGLKKISDIFGVDGRKTAISLAIMVLGGVLGIYPDGLMGQIFGAILSYLSDMPHDILISKAGEVLVTGGSLGWFVGLYHKLLKKLKEKLAKEQNPSEV